MSSIEKNRLVSVVCNRIVIFVTPAFTGLEYVIEIKYKGRKEPRYACRLCGYYAEVAPMIEHLSGYKHRREYIVSNFDAF